MGKCSRLKVVGNRIMLKYNYGKGIIIEDNFYKVGKYIADTSNGFIGKYIVGFNEYILLVNERKIGIYRVEPEISLIGIIDNQSIVTIDYLVSILKDNQYNIKDCNNYFKGYVVLQTLDRETITCPTFKCKKCRDNYLILKYTSCEYTISYVWDNNKMYNIDRQNVVFDIHNLNTVFSVWLNSSNVGKLHIGTDEKNVAIFDTKMVGKEYQDFSVVLCESKDNAQFMALRVSMGESRCCARIVECLCIIRQNNKIEIYNNRFQLLYTEQITDDLYRQAQDDNWVRMYVKKVGILAKVRNAIKSMETFSVFDVTYKRKLVIAKNSSDTIRCINDFYSRPMSCYDKYTNILKAQENSLMGLDVSVELMDTSIKILLDLAYLLEHRDNIKVDLTGCMYLYIAYDLIVKSKKNCKVVINEIENYCSSGRDKVYIDDIPVAFECGNGYKPNINLTINDKKLKEKIIFSMDNRHYDIELHSNITFIKAEFESGLIFNDLKKQSQNDNNLLCLSGYSDTKKLNRLLSGKVKHKVIVIKDLDLYKYCRKLLYNEEISLNNSIVILNSIRCIYTHKIRILEYANVDSQYYIGLDEDDYWV